MGTSPSPTFFGGNLHGIHDRLDRGIERVIHAHLFRVHPRDIDRLSGVVPARLIVRNIGSRRDIDFAQAMARRDAGLDASFQSGDQVLVHFFVRPGCVFDRNGVDLASNFLRHTHLSLRFVRIHRSLHGRSYSSAHIQTS